LLFAQPAWASILLFMLPIAAGLEPQTSQSQSPECWDYRCVPPGPALILFS
jgi:hypothetical protein